MLKSFILASTNAARHDICGEQASLNISVPHAPFRTALTGPLVCTPPSDRGYDRRFKLFKRPDLARQSVSKGKAVQNATAAFFANVLHSYGVGSQFETWRKAAALWHNESDQVMTDWLGECLEIYQVCYESQSPDVQTLVKKDLSRYLRASYVYCPEEFCDPIALFVVNTLGTMVIRLDEYICVVRTAAQLGLTRQTIGDWITERGGINKIYADEAAIAMHGV